MFDRDNSVFETSQLTNALVNGELVIANVNGMKVY